MSDVNADCPNCGYELQAIHDQAAELTRLRAQVADLTAKLGEAREVKPLEWDDFARDSFTAQCPFGDYVVELHDGWGMWTPDEGEMATDAHSYYPSAEAAKAAAQADYTARILSAMKGTS